MSNKKSKKNSTQAEAVETVVTETADAETVESEETKSAEEKKEKANSKILEWIKNNKALDALILFAIFELAVILVGILALLVLGVCAYLLPLIVRYSNTLRQHLGNALALAVVKLPKTLLLVVLNLLPALLLLLSPRLFAQTLIFWVVIGFAFVAYIQESLLKSVYAQLEKGNQSVTLGM